MQLVRVGLCAFGMSGKVFHAPFLKQHPGFDLVGIVERSKNESQSLYSEAKIYRSVEEMLANSDINLVIVNTPVQTHFEYCKKAIAAGKNIIVEKPFTVNTKEAEELCKLAEEKGVFLSVFQNRRFDRDYFQVENIIKQNVLGDIKEVEIRFDRYRITPSAKIHKEDPDLQGAGALHDLGAHLIDQAVQLFGYPESIFADVYSMKGHNTANDYFEILFYYDNDLRVRLKSSVFTKEDHFAYKLHGSKGSFLQERSDAQEVELVAGAIPLFNENWVQPLTSSDAILNAMNDDGEWSRTELWSEPSSYMDYFHEIYEHIVFDNKLPSPGKEIIQNMKIIDGTLESAQKGSKIKL